MRSPLCMLVLRSCNPRRALLIFPGSVKTKVACFWMRMRKHIFELESHRAKPMNTTAAKELIPERLKFFPPPPAFDPTPLLDEKIASVYNNPIACGRSPVDAETQPPKVQVRATRENLVSL